MYTENGMLLEGENVLGPCVESVVDSLLAKAKGQIMRNGNEAKVVGDRNLAARVISDLT